MCGFISTGDTWVVKHCNTWSTTFCCMLLMRWRVALHIFTFRCRALRTHPESGFPTSALTPPPHLWAPCNWGLRLLLAQQVPAWHTPGPCHLCTCFAPPLAPTKNKGTLCYMWPVVGTPQAAWCGLRPAASGSTCDPSHRQERRQPPLHSPKLPCCAVSTGTWSSSPWATPPGPGLCVPPDIPSLQCQ